MSADRFWMNVLYGALLLLFIAWALCALALAAGVAMGRWSW